MINLLLVGCMGRMGRAVSDMAAKEENLRVCAGVDLVPQKAAYPVYQSLTDVQEPVDVLIDFSHPSSLESVLEYGMAHRVPLVLAATGYKDDQLALIRETAKNLPIFSSFNMSLGVNLLISLTKIAARVLGDDFDVEIIEKHHNQKLDAPSGTALMLVQAVEEAKGSPMQREYDRHARRAVRAGNEIGIHSVRGGNLVGEHEVLFAGMDETVTLHHEAFSRDIFAKGALRAARFMCGRRPGLYDMRALIEKTL